MLSSALAAMGLVTIAVIWWRVGRRVTRSRATKRQVVAMVVYSLSLALYCGQDALAFLWPQYDVLVWAVVLNAIVTWWFVAFALPSLATLISQRDLLDELDRLDRSIDRAERTLERTR